MTYSQKHRLHGATAFILAVIMILSVSPMSIFAADVQGAWTITNDGTSSGVAKYEKFDLAYYSPTTNITSGNAYGKDWVRSSNCNGSASNGIVVTEGKSYVKFTPPCDGTLYAYIGAAASKTGYVSKTKGSESTAVGSFVPGGSENNSAPGFQVYQGGTVPGLNEKMARLDIETESGTDYYITVSGSKMLFYDPEFVPYTKVSGTISDSFNIGSYPIKFVNKETGEEKVPAVDGNKYETTLKPGEYSVALTGSAAAKYAISAATRNITVEGSETAQPKSQTADLAIEESVSYTVSGKLIGMDKTYDDMKVVFVPADQASHESAAAEISGDTYSAQLAANETYTATLVGAMDYEIAEEVVVTNDSDAAVTKDITFKAKDLYTVSGGFIKLGSERHSYIPVTDVNFSEVIFTNVDDKYTYKATVADNKYTVALRKGAYQASIPANVYGGQYSTTTHVVVDGENTGRDLLLAYNSGMSGVSIPYSDTLYVGKDKEYKTVQAAVNAVNKMFTSASPAYAPVTIKIDPGVYREQVVVNSPNITFESNGGDASNTKITWYYGIGYKYYSGVNS